MDFKNFKPKEVKTEELSVTLEIKLQKCGLTETDAFDAINFWATSPNTKSLSYLINDLLRITKASTWETGSILVRTVEK